MSPPDAIGARDATGSTASASSGVMQCGAAWRAITRGAGTWRPAGPRRTAGAWLGVITSAPKVCATSRANAICICSSARPTRLWLRVAADVRRPPPRVATSKSEMITHPSMIRGSVVLGCCTFEQILRRGTQGLRSCRILRRGVVSTSRRAGRLICTPSELRNFLGHGLIFGSACVGRSSICGRR